MSEYIVYWQDRAAAIRRKVEDGYAAPLNVKELQALVDDYEALKAHCEVTVPALRGAATALKLALDEIDALRKE